MGVIKSSENFPGDFEVSQRLTHLHGKARKTYFAKLENSEAVAAMSLHFFSLGSVFREVSKIKVMFVTFSIKEISNVSQLATHSQVDVETEFGMVSPIPLVYKV